MKEEYQITPIQKISGDFHGNSLYIKRDDLFPFSFGGNKARKGLLFFEEIMLGRFDYVVTYGTDTSNHCRVIANLAKSNGVPCLIISPDVKSQDSYNSLLVNTFGASIIKCKVVEVKDRIEYELQRLTAQGFKPYFIQGGGHGDIGTQAYVNAYNEIKQAEKFDGIFFDYIFLATGTGTTQAGLVCGKIMNADNKIIVGISIARKKTTGKQVVKDSVQSYLDKMGTKKADEEDIIFVDDYILGGYADYNEKIENIIKKFLSQNGIPLDPIYTGKAFLGMEEFLLKYGISDKNILFLHTGGLPLFFDYLNHQREGVQN